MSVLLRRAAAKSPVDKIYAISKLASRITQRPAVIYDNETPKYYFRSNLKNKTK